MLAPVLEKLLILQDRDAKRLALETQIKAVPRDIAAVEQKIAAEKAAIEAARDELKGLETKKKLIETEIGSAEDKLSRYRTQQSQVRKNDEYQALGHEIESGMAVENLSDGLWVYQAKEDLAPGRPGRIVVRAIDHAGNSVAEVRPVLRT